MIVVPDKFGVAARYILPAPTQGRGIATFSSVSTDSGYIGHDHSCGTSRNRNLLKANRQTTFQPLVCQTPPDTNTSDMFFSLHLLFVFAISVAAVPPSPHSIDTTIAERQRDPVDECKNRTIIEQKTLESGVVATRHLCHDLVERRDGLEPCHYVTGGGKISPTWETQTDMCKIRLVPYILLC
jgi:hypothetical protein